MNAIAHMNGSEVSTADRRRQSLGMAAALVAAFATLVALAAGDGAAKATTSGPSEAHRSSPQLESHAGPGWNADAKRATFGADG